MILADKIINERKKNGWSQEELAEKLSVSRQSVSKWEGAQAVPDLQKILKMAELFNVSTDYLLKDEIEAEPSTASLRVDSEDVPMLTKVSMEEANAFLKYRAWSIPRIALGIFLCINCADILILMSGLSNFNNLISETLACAIGLPLLFVILAIAITIFIRTESKGKKFNYLNYKDIDTEYGVEGLVRELKEKNAREITTKLIIGICLTLLCSVPLIITALASLDNMIIICMVCVLLLMVGSGVYLIILACGKSASYDMLLQERDYSHEGKSITKKLSPFKSLYWGIATASFIIYSFLTGKWGFSWVIFAIAGVVFPVFLRILKIVFKIDDSEMD